MEDKVKFTLRNLPIPNFLYKENRLSLITLKTYCFIHAYTNAFKFSNEHLAEMFDCHPDTISTSINQLEKYGYIKTTYTSKAGGGKTRLCLDTQSESVSRPSGSKKNEPTTLSPDSDKDKGNILKGKNLENYQNLSYEEIMKLPSKIRKEVLDLLKGKGRGNKAYFQNVEFNRSGEIVKKPAKKAVILEGIL